MSPFIVFTTLQHTEGVGNWTSAVCLIMVCSSLETVSISPYSKSICHRTPNNLINPFIHGQ